MPDGFHDATKAWFEENFGQPTDVQKKGWPAIRGGRHALLVAPTGSGKTLAAFLSGIDRLGSEAKTDGVRVLYISPLKALVYDIERNLRAPLVGITRVAEREGLDFREPGVAIRTGDTPQRERQRMIRHPADILVTTPESLYLMLGSKVADTLKTVETVIVDEIHALAPTKRGTHLALSLERLAELCEKDPQRIGLSATARPLDAVARFLGGDREVDIVDCSAKPRIDLKVTVPVPDMQNPPVAVQQEKEDKGGSILGELYSREIGRPQTERGIWPSIYPELLTAVRENRSTIIFVNSRGRCERLAHQLNELAEEELVRAHHGSISHEKRAEIEEGLKAGQIRGIVATSSLELGIDMGAVDLVLLVESPGSVARGLQRVGRAGHGVDEVSVGRLYPKFRGDLLESAVVAERMQRAEIDAITVPVNVIDVLSQQIVAMCCQQPMPLDDIERVVRRCWSYRRLSREALEGVLDMLSGRYPSSDFADLKPLLSWDRADNVLSPRRGAALVTRMNAGTIPDRGAFGVHLGEDGPRVGELDEEMVYETRLGDNITLGASTWKVEGITRDRVIVSPAPGETGRLPFWRGDGPGRPVELGRAIGAFLRKIGRKGEQKAAAWLEENTTLDHYAAQNLAAYIAEQRRETGTLPTDRAITVERFRDELGDWRICILSPFGSRIHAPWSMALQRMLSDLNGFEIQVMYTDDGIVLRFADTEELPDVDLLLPDPDEVEELITEQLASTSMFAGLFRENAVRSLLLKRRRPGQRSPLWAQRLKAQNLLATVRRYPNFPIVIETYRQALGDIFDVPGLKSILTDIRKREILIDEVETPSASPFARSLVFAYVAAYLYEQDAPLAERKAQALTLDRALLGELLGQAELRDLIDADVLADLERDLQFLSPDYHARDADELHDLLRRLGDLDEEELAARSDGDIGDWLVTLEKERRAISIRFAGNERWIAAEDAGLYRDALGTVPPSGLPDSFLEAVEQPFEALLKRYARHHGPFLTREPAARFGVREAQLDPVLKLLEQRGVLVHGEIRPGGAAPEWCDAEVLRRLKRRNLAELRDEVAAVDASAYALFLPAWHGIGDGRRGIERLKEAIGQLQDLPLPWSLLSGTILPSRVSEFRLDALDMLAASGAVVWVGRGAAGTRDGRIALYLREHARDLLSHEAYEPRDALESAILERLRGGGASFYIEIEDHVREQAPDAGAKDIREALWSLVWAGQITNDTFGPLRDLARRAPRRGRPGITVSGGRWSLVESLAGGNPTKQAVARSRLFLDRYGVVSRQAAAAEGGGFGALYKVLRELEEQGRVKRGYFVEGLDGAQFAYAGAVDRLRECREDSEERDKAVSSDDILILPAMDPANPFGASLPWPPVGNVERAKPRRVADSWLLLARGRPVLYVARRGRALITFPDALSDDDTMLGAAIGALRRVPKSGKQGLLVIETVDGVDVLESPVANALRAAGFSTDYRGLIDTQGSYAGVGRA